MSDVFELGLQVERTALAWRRNALSLGVACMGCARLISSFSADWAAGVVTAGVAAAAIVSVFAWRRHNAMSTALLGSTSELALRPPGGGVLAALSVLQAGGGLVALILLLS